MGACAELAQIGSGFPKIFPATGRRKFPVYLTRDKAEARFDMWRIINETRMTRNNWSFLGENFDTLHPTLKMFRSVAEQNQQRIRSRYLRTLSLEGNSMDDIPDAQPCEAADKDVDWPTLVASVKLRLPSDIALSLSGSNPDWNASSSKRSRDQLDASSSKISKRNEMEDNVSIHDTGLDEFGLPRGDWEDSLVDLTAEDLQNAMDLPLAGWATPKFVWVALPLAGWISPWRDGSKFFMGVLHRNSYCPKTQPLHY